MPLVLPIPADARLRRFVQLYFGLVLFGFSTALLVKSRLGLDPWDVLHQGIARRVGITIGIATIAISGVVLLLWIPLRQRPGLGTLSNAIVIGLAIDATLSLLSSPSTLVGRGLVLAAGIVLNGIATGLYIGAGMGPGPRDGLMTGLHHRFGWSIRRARTSVELTVLVAGYLLGGTVGLGTVLFAFGIGPLVQVSLGVFDREGRVSRRERATIGEPGAMPGE